MGHFLGTVSCPLAGVDKLNIVIISASTWHLHCKLAHLRPAGHHGMLAYLRTHVITCGMAGDSALPRRPREGRTARMAAY